MHFLQHPFRASNSASSLSFFDLWWYFSPGLYSGSSPLLIKSSFEQPMHPHVWQPCSPIDVLLWSRGTTQTHAFLEVSVCLQILQHCVEQYIHICIWFFYLLVSPRWQALLDCNFTRNLMTEWMLWYIWDRMRVLGRGRFLICFAFVELLWGLRGFSFTTVTHWFFNIMIIPPFKNLRRINSKSLIVIKFYEKRATLLTKFI